MRVETLRSLHYHRGEIAALPILISFILSWKLGPVSKDAYLAAALLFSLGFLIRIWAQTHLHYRLGMELGFTDSGPFAFTRNPIYIANAMMAAGLVIASGVLWILPITLIVCAISYSLAVTYEESELPAKYGEQYARYLSEVPKWFPRWAGFQHLNMVRAFLPASLKTELYNLLFIVPLIVKELLTRHV